MIQDARSHEIKNWLFSVLCHKTQPPNLLVLVTSKRCYVLLYSIILHNSNNIEYDVGYEAEGIWPKGGSSILTMSRFLGRTENNSRVSSVSKKIITTIIPKIQNKAAMKRVAVRKYYTFQKLPISEPKKKNHHSQGIKTNVLHNTPFICS
jgi:hypothetical protein